MAKYVDLNILRLTYFHILKIRALALFSLMERSFTWHSQLRFVSIFTPRYLTLLVGYSLLPHSLFSTHLQISFVYRYKDHHLSFFTLSEILFVFKQLTRCFKSILTSLFKLLIELLIHNRLVSSAKWWTL